MFPRPGAEAAARVLRWLLLPRPRSACPEGGKPLASDSHQLILIQVTLVLATSESRLPIVTHCSRYGGHHIETLMSEPTDEEVRLA